MNQLKTRAFCAYFLISFPVYLTVVIPFSLIMAMVHTVFDAHGAQRIADALEDFHEAVADGLRGSMYPSDTVRSIFTEYALVKNWWAAWKKVITA